MSNPTDKIKFDVEKLSLVDINLVIPNIWNPKQKQTDEFEKVKLSIKKKGLRSPIIVRNHPTEEGQYEIIDGEQRFTSCKQLGYQQILIYNEGEVSNRESMELTIFFQQQVPFDTVSLANLVGDLFEKFEDIELPFSEDEIDAMSEEVGFDWERDQLNKEEDLEFRQFKVTLTKDQYLIVAKAIRDITESHDSKLTKAHALELICANYLT